MSEQASMSVPRVRSRAAAWLVVVCGAAVTAALACSTEKRPVAPASPGGPAYWESNVPGETLPERMPDPGLTPGVNPEGTTDKFLWEDGAGPPQGPDAQIPMKAGDSTSGEPEAHVAANKVDGGADSGLDSGAP